MNNPKTTKLILELYNHLLQEPEYSVNEAKLLNILLDMKESISDNVLNSDEWSNKVIQVVPMKDFNSLYIVDFDVERMLLSVRKSNSLNLVEVLAVSINESTVFAPGFDFSVYFLNQFIFNNHEHYDSIIGIEPNS